MADVVPPDGNTRLDYEQTLETYRQLADIRFKLLAFVPTISGAAAALLTSSDLDSTERFLLASLGLLVTLGVILYDQRNTQFYNGCVSRAQHLEEDLDLAKFENDRHVGLFGSRQDHPRLRFLGVRVGHDLGLAFIYGSTTGMWAFVALYALVPRSAGWDAVAAACVVALSIAQLEWNDGWPKRFRTWLQSQRVHRGDPIESPSSPEAGSGKP